jgi:septal ring factor EnvC (AmiA/AmiB activator)
VVVSNGQLGVAPSSARFKDKINPMDNASEALLALKPVTFRYKKEIDPAGTRQLGLVAEDVERVNPDLVVRDKEGKPYSVRYDQVNAMLLNEFLKEHRKVEQQDRKLQEQEATTTELKKEIASLTATVKEQAAQIQKVSAQVEASSRVARMVLNSP